MKPILIKIEGFHHDEEFIDISERLCYWVKEVTNEDGVKLIVDAVENTSFYSPVTKKTVQLKPYIQLTLTFTNKELYNLFLISFDKTEYKSYIVASHYHEI